MSHLDLSAQAFHAVANGGELALPPMKVGHYPISDTELVSALRCFGIALRNPEPFTHDVVLDAHGDETRGPRIIWWMARANPEGTQKTEELSGYWEFAERFRAEHPIHELTAMLDARDARDYWLSAIKTRGLLPLEVRDGTPVYLTDSLTAASILKACGFTPLAFTGRAFVLARTHGGVEAEQLLLDTVHATGTAAAWMHAWLIVLNDCLKIVKRQQLVVQQRFDGVTMLLTADATAATRDKFFRARNLL